ATQVVALGIQGRFACERSFCVRQRYPESPNVIPSRSPTTDHGSTP
uniref:Uncharacterized protein n=1 Tax=Aegilops tauschii subsp. strangulata TaxID=200361 RepID=A0A453BU69_AEGTS